MPTKKQRRRAEKERRHEYETVWVDAEGNELEEPPEEPQPAPRPPRDEGKAKTKAQPQRGGRAVRVPPPPSWQRAARRALVLGAVVFALFYLVGAKNGGHPLLSAIEISVVYTVLFIPFTYVIDRFSHNRWQKRAEQQGAKAQPKKR
jgi:hypothetical protein